MILARNALTPFLLISLAFHLLFLVRWPARAPRERDPGEIPVTVLPAPPIEESPPKEAPAKAAPTPAEAGKPAAQPAKPTTRSAKAAASTEAPRSQPSAPVAVEERPSQVEVARARVVEVEPAPPRPLPKLKDLVPNAVGLALGEAGGSREKPISLSSRDPRYVPYLTLIQEAINSQWSYPPLALSYGMEGKATLEFMILDNGQLGGAALIQSSGYPLLDQAAMRALMAASPFPPLPPRMGKSRMYITAGFLYVDNRVKYSPGP